MTIKMPHIVKPVDERKADAFIAGGTLKTAAPQETEKTVVNMRFDTALLERIDAAAKRQGISRTAWLHVAASKALES
jgi:predicted HicB family RNase H-like nuclease